jgi:hypothetical protein
MKPEKAAKLICRGLERDHAIIQFPFLLAILARLGGILPESVRGWFAPRFVVSNRIVTE